MKGCPARQISGVNFGRGKIHALFSLFASMAVRTALPSIFRQRFFSGAVLSVASVGIEDEDGTVFAGDLDRLAGFGALVEQVETWLRIVVGSDFRVSSARAFSRIGSTNARTGFQVPLASWNSASRGSSAFRQSQVSSCRRYMRSAESLRLTR